METIEILYTCNKKYLTFMMSSMLSVVKNNLNNKITFHLILDGMDENDIDTIKRYFDKFSNVSINVYNARKIDIYKYKIPTWRNNQTANTLLFFQEIMGSKILDIDNLLYIDADTIVMDDLTTLEKYSDYTIGAVKDGCLRKDYKKLGDLNRYYNSGVLYINIKQWLKNNCQDRIIRFVEKDKRQFVFPDQDIINCALQEDIRELPLRYNMGPCIYILRDSLRKLYYSDKYRDITYEEVIQNVDNPVVFHSYGIANIKPWIKNNINPFNEVFMKYIQEVDPSFTREELSLLKKVISSNKLVFELLLLMRNKQPSKLNEKIRRLIHKN